MNAAMTTAIKKRRAQAKVPARPFKELTPTQKKVFLRVGAEEFARNYSGVIKKLANE